MLDQNPPIISRHSADPNLALQRQTMVDRQIRTFDVTDHSVIERMLEVPREIFLPADLASLAYCDGQLSVAGEEPGVVRTLLAPLALARLIQAAALARHEKVLVVGDGPGYATALVAGLAQSVVALESDPAFAMWTREACGKIGIDNVKAFAGQLTAGYRPALPYDVIFVLGVVETGLDELYKQLSDSGRILTFRKPPRDPSGRAAKAVRITRVDSDFCERPLFDAAAPVLDVFRAKPTFVF